MIKQTHTFKMFILQCKNHIPHVKINPFVIYELRFTGDYMEDAHKIECVSKYFENKSENGEYCRYD